MKNENWLKTLLVFLSLTSFILTFLLYNTNTRYNKFETTYKLETDSLQATTDSLREENFILKLLAIFLEWKITYTLNHSFRRFANLGVHRHEDGRTVRLPLRPALYDGG